MSAAYQNTYGSQTGVAAFLNIGLSTVWKWHAEGKLPPGIRISPRCTVWRRSDLEAFLERQARRRKGQGETWLI